MLNEREGCRQSNSKFIEEKKKWGEEEWKKRLRVGGIVMVRCAIMGRRTKKGGEGLEKE